MNKETIALIYNLEAKINSQKEWIEIANIICENEDLPDVKLYLILEILDKLHKRYYRYIKYCSAGSSGQGHFWWQKCLKTTTCTPFANKL